MVTYIKSDLEFILDQIKIAEAHAAGQPLFGPGGLVPAYTLSYGLRTVDGTYNNLLPGQETWGSSDRPFIELLDPVYRPADGTVFDPDGPGGAPAMPTAPNYNPSNNPNSLVFDSSLRTISNLIVDQTLKNPAAILIALERAGNPNPMADLAAVTAIYEAFEPSSNAEYQARVVKQAAQSALNDDPLNPLLIQALADATAVHNAATTVLLDARIVRDAALEPFGIAMDGDNVSLLNIAPDEGLSAPFNSWFTLFGQFFDHGLDLVNKGGSGTVFIPLAEDDPLYVPGSHTNFMVLTRATVTAGVDGIMGTSDDVRPVNTTTPFVDQNQTYTSHPSHQVFLRQYALRDVDAGAGVTLRPFATGHLIEGGGDEPGGMATWGEVKAQASDILGINLTDSDVGSVPLMRTDPYGNFIPGPNGFPQLIMGIGADGIPNTADDIVLEGNPAANGGLGVSTLGALRTNMAFLADIAHDAVPVGKIADGDITVGLANPGNGDTEYDNELLDAHFVAGDGRANENIGLTAVHHIFHSEHNRLADHTKVVVVADAVKMLNSGSTQAQAVAFLNEWLAIDVTTVPVTPAEVSALVWDGNRLFQAAKFGTEMQYQHLVFEDFARKIQPAIDFFVVPDGYHADINPNIVAEFAHVVYRFGHSMLTEQIDRLDATFTNDQIGLVEAFLNPIEFDSGHTVADNVAAGDIIRGMTRQVGNDIDEFVTTALRNNLLGLPLDLATINLARGRDTGVPSLNAARREFYQVSQNAPELKPYSSWVEFAGGLKNEASVINFIAAYGLHPLITSQTTVEGKRDAAMTIIFNQSFGGLDIPLDRVAFLNSTGTTWSNLAGGITTTGLENIDLWIGGLAEKIMPFGGMLGSTFNFVFEVQLEKLQDGDRFYYLQRLDGLHLLSEMENNTFAKLISKNADAGHLPSDVFSTPGLILEVDQTKQWNPGLGNADPTGSSILVPIVSRDNPDTPTTDTNYLKYTGDEHVLLGGSSANDILIASIGDDTLYGDAGNDRMEGGFGNDQYIGGDGDDIITDMGGDDIIRSGTGHDAIHAGPGTDLVVSEAGQDFIVLGADMLDEAFAGLDNDFILGSKTTEQTMGGEGHDWIEVGAWTGAVGDNFDDQFAADSVKGHDVFHGDGGFDEFIGEGGDDIWVGSLGRGKFDGMSGFDWATYKDMQMGINADLFRLHFDALPLPPPNAALDEYAFVEGVSGSHFNDEILGSDVTAADMPTEGARGSVLDAEGIALISGLQALLGAGVTSFAGGNILLGGGGSDLITGRGGDDIIDGDKWLNVRISVRASYDANGPIGPEIATFDSMKDLVTKIFDGTYNPGQLQIVREILKDDGVGDTDTALYSGARGEYAFSSTADGQIIVTHSVPDGDGTDRLSNIEKIQFATGNALNIIVGTPGNDAALNGTVQDDLILGLAGVDTLNGLAGDDILVGGPGGTTATNTYLDNFDGNASYSDNNGSANFAAPWSETNDTGNAGGAAGGDIEISGGRLRFDENINGNEIIARNVNLAGALSATLSFSYEDAGLDASSTGNPVENVVLEAWNGTSWDILETFGGNTPTGSNTFSIALTAAQMSAASSIRFRAEGDWEGGENFYIDNFLITATVPAANVGVDTLNGGLGNDTYSFTLGDGNDVINEGVSATSGGTADKISILAPVTGTDVDGLPIYTLTSLNAQDNDGGTNNGDLVINYSLPNGATSTAQTITVVNHFDGTNAETGVERINFNGALVHGYALGSEDYLISRLDPANRDGGGVNLSASLVNNFIVGEQGTSDDITGGSGNDLIFGASGNNDLVGGLGDDLLVGGTGNDDLDNRLNVAQDDFEGAVGADTMVGGAGSDTYGVDDLLDVVVEAANEGTDTVETFLTALSIEAMANVENLVYLGADAGAFVGTGNSGNNSILGGDLNDTLSGLAGNDSLNGGLGADTMIGGDGSDVYFVDDAGDVVTETTADLVIGGTDRVESDVSYALGANVENLDLNNNAVRGTGNAAANTINGNGANNELFGLGGIDTLNGDDGNDLLDGGDGNDIINGGDDNDTIIGGAGSDTIDVGTGFNTVVYNAAGFGADIVTSFDSIGGTAANQDLINISALGITAANFASRVTIADIEDGATDDTLITIYDAAGIAGGVVLGTVRLEEVEATVSGNGATAVGVSVLDFILAGAAPTSTINGDNSANTLNGVGTTSETFNANGGNDTVNANGGNDVVSGGDGADTLNGGDGNDTLSGGSGILSGTFGDNFDGAASYTDNNGTIAFAGGWTEGGGETTGANNGSIQINAANGSRLHFEPGIGGGEFIQRAFDLTGASAATIQFAYVGDAGLTGGENVTVQAWNHTTNTWQPLTNGALSTASGTFNATLSADQIGPNSAIRFLANGNWDTGDDFFIDNFIINASGNLGFDTVNGDAGDDTIVWNANASGATDGKDIINGGTEGGAGDTFSIVGNASAETYRIYSRAAFLSANPTALLAVATEIVVTRNGTNAASVIAELNEIEEIRLNGNDPSGATGTAGNDNFEIIGDFSGTSLRLNTITIDGDAGDDVIDISALTSAHRIVFRSNGGHDTILGTLRPQDVIELPPGMTMADFVETTDENGVTTLSDGEHSIRYVSHDGPPIIDDGEDDEDEEEDEDDHVPGDDDDEDYDDEDEDDDAPSVGGPIVGTAHDDVLLGTSGGDLVFGFAGVDHIIANAGVDVIRAGSGDDFVDAGAGRDIIFADDGDDDVFGGDDDDLIYGEAGDDRLFGGSGNDLIDAGADDDTVFGGAGNDLFVASLNDGSDTYYGGDISGDAGNDTLDLAFLTVDAVVDLGTGVGGRGSVVSGQSGTDTLYGVENITTGSGDDVITMSNAVNVVDGGAGEDIFVFGSTAAAHGDTIRGFEAGDKIDLSGIDANAGLGGNNSFTLESGQATTAPGQIVVTHETREDGEYTVISGNTAGDTAPEFRISIAGNHALTGTDFNL